MHVTDACCCNFLGNDIDDSEDDDYEDDNGNYDDEYDENDGIHSFDELISGFISGKMASPKGRSIPNI